MCFLLLFSDPCDTDRVSRTFASLLLFLLVSAPAVAQTPDVSGTWAQVVVTTAQSKIPVLGNVETTTYVYSVTRIEQNGTKLRATTDPCWVRIEGPVNRVQPIVPDATRRAIGRQVRSGSVDSGTGRVHFDGLLDVLGAELDNTAADPLPTTPDDPRVRDEDSDGYPGVTIRMVGLVDGEIRVVQRTYNELSGSVSAELIAGRVKWKTEQTVLGATNRFLNSNPDSKPHPDPAKSHFMMVRTAPKTTCEDVVSSHAKLFPIAENQK